MSVLISISDPVLQALADITFRHGKVHNDGALRSLATKEWDVEVDFTSVFGNHLSLAEQGGPRRLIWTFDGKTCDYRCDDGQPSEAEAKIIATTVLESLRSDMQGDEKQDGEDEAFWWLAINGPSCAAAWFPLPATLEVHPRPQQLIGFRSREEQIKTQRFLLEAPIKDVKRFMTKTLSGRVRRGEVVYLRPDKPEPPTHGPTLWACSPRHRTK